MLQQVFDLGVEMRPRDDLDPRIHRPRLLDDLSGLERIRDRDEQQLCLRQIRGAQDARIGGVPLDDLDPGGPELLDRVVGVFDDEKRPAALAQHRTDQPPDAAIADEHDMPGEARLRQFLLIRAPARAGPPPRHGGGGAPATSSARQRRPG